MHTIGYLEYLLLSSLFTLGACECADGPKAVELSNFSGNISSESGWKEGDKCEWKLSPPSDGDHYKLRINIIYANCSDKFKIKRKPYCNITTPHTVFYVRDQSSKFCGDCNEKQRCFSFSKDVKVSYENYGDGFSLNYQFVSCTKTTPSPTTAVMTSMLSINPSDDSTSVSPSKNSAESLPMDTTPRDSTPPSDSSTRLLVSIFVPVVIILAIAVVVLVIIMIMRRRKSELQSDADVIHFATTAEIGISFPAGADTGVYESIDDHAQVAGTAYGNQAFQPVISASGGDSYAVVDDGAVYYSGVAEDESQNGARHLPAHAYEQVALDVEVIENDHIAGATLTRPHNYDEVTLEVGGESTEEALEIRNVIYEDSRSNM